MIRVYIVYSSKICIDRFETSKCNIRMGRKYAIKFEMKPT